MPDPTRWQLDRIRELDAIDAKVAALPPILGNMARERARALRRHVSDLTERRSRGSSHGVVANMIGKLAAELDRIKVEDSNE